MFSLCVSLGWLCFFFVELGEWLLFLCWVWLGFLGFWLGWGGVCCFVLGCGWVCCCLVRVWWGFLVFG